MKRMTISVTFLLSTLLANQVPAAVKCENVLSSSSSAVKSKAIKPGSYFRMALGSNYSDVGVQYIGKYNGQHRGILLGETDHILVISEAKAKSLNLDAGKIDIPAIEKQTSGDNCLPTAVAYVQKMLENENGRATPGLLQGRIMDSYMTPSSIDPFSMSRYFPMASMFTSSMQISRLKQTLSSSGIKYHEVTTTEDIVAALVDGKRVLFGASVIREQLKFRDENGEVLGNVAAATPSNSGQNGHAMVAVGIVKAENENLLLVADPASGELVIVPDADSSLMGIQKAFVIDGIN